MPSAPLRIARLVEQRVGLGDVEGIGRHAGVVKLRRILRDDAGRRLGVAEEDRLDDEILVDRMRDRLADLEVGELLAAVVDLDDELVGQPLIAVRIDFDAVDLGDALEVGERHLAEGGELDLVGFERAGRRRAVGQHAVDDLVELGLAFAPIGVVLRPAGNIRRACARRT